MFSLLLCGYCFFARRIGDAKAEIRRLNKKNDEMCRNRASIREDTRRTQPTQETSHLSRAHGCLSKLAPGSLTGRREHRWGGCEAQPVREHIKVLIRAIRNH